MEFIDKTSQTLENTKILFTLDFYHSTHQVDKRTRNHLTLQKPSFNLLLCSFSGFHISYLALLSSNPSHTPLLYGLPKSVHPTSPHPNLHILHFSMVSSKSLYVCLPYLPSNQCYQYGVAPPTRSQTMSSTSCNVF